MSISEPDDSIAKLYVTAGATDDAFINQDHVQEAVIRYWEHLTHGRAIRSAPAWVRAVAQNLARSEERRRRAEGRALERLAHEAPSWPMEPDPVVDLVRSLITELPARQRQIVVLHYYGDLTVADVAATTGCSVGTVKATLHHARRSLGAALLAEVTISPQKEESMRPVHWGITGTHWNEYELETTDESLDGHRVAVFRCTVDEPGGFGAAVQTFEPGEFNGRRIRFSGRLRSQGVSGWAGLWMRVDGPDAAHRALAFYNNEDRGLTGSTDWAMQDAVLDVAPDATVVLIGAILSGRGELYLADLDVTIVDEMTPVSIQHGRKDRPLPRPMNLSFEENH